MAQNRIIPFGYAIENGKLTTELAEEKIVVQIYTRYAEGQSYKTIAQWLTDSDIKYTQDKPNWNKNMVARILQNKNYLGTEKYPRIVAEELHQQSQQQAKPYTHTETDDIKNLKPLLRCSECGEIVKRRLKTDGNERWYCPNSTKHISVKLTDKILLESIQKLQEKLLQTKKTKSTKQEKNKTINLELIKLKNQIDTALSESEPNIEQIKQSIMTLASEKYNALNSESMDSNVLSHTIQQISQTELDSNSIKAIAKTIRVSDCQATELVLKNNETISL